MYVHRRGVFSCFIWTVQQGCDIVPNSEQLQIKTRKFYKTKNHKNNREHPEQKRMESGMDERKPIVFIVDVES